MKRTTRRVMATAAMLVIVFLFIGGYYSYQLAAVGAGYMAKMMCSHVFISGMDPDQVANADVYDPLLETFSYQVDYQNKSVTVSAPLDLLKRTAVFRPCLGAVLNPAVQPATSGQESVLCKTKPDSGWDSCEWPLGDRVDTAAIPDNVDRKALQQVIEETFSEPDPHRLRRTRAVVVIYKGRLIAEKYAPPFNKNTPLIGWSMTKSVTSALVGILVGRGKLSPERTFTISEWGDKGDPRRTITLEQMLRMCSGLEFDESYGNPLSDVVVMLFNSPDAAHFAADKPLQNTPGSRWSYSSGTTNIISQIIRRSFGGDYDAYLRFPFESLFNKIGMQSVVMETDPAGTFVGSSFAYASARDWARFGLLYLQDGVWDGERILPEGWVAFSASRTEISKNGRYAAHFWLPAVEEENQDLKGMFYASGHDGQYVNIVPAHDLVVVRLGLTKQGGWDQLRFVKDIIATLD